MNKSKKLAANLMNMQNLLFPGYNKDRNLAMMKILLLVLAIFIPACTGANSKHASDHDTAPNLMGLPLDHAVFLS